MSAAVRRTILDERGTLFGINVHLATEIVMGGMALWMIIAWFRERNRKRCASCSHCSEPHSSGGHPEQETNANALMLWTMGSLYGISPCAPLILMLGYAVTMPAYAAALTGTVFALSSAIVPTIFMQQVKKLLKMGLITVSDYWRINTKMKEKYKPVSDGLMSENELLCTGNRA